MSGERGFTHAAASVLIETVTERDLEELLPLMRAYCDFYRASPADSALLELSRALIADPQGEGLQLLARADDREAIGFATLLWSWDTTLGARIGILHDLFVSPRARGRSVAEELIGACRERSRRHGTARLAWQTAPDNLRAQTVYDRVGGTRETWLEYWLDT